MKLQDFDLHGFYREAYRWLFIHGTKFVLSLILLFIGLRLIKFIGNRLRGRMSRQMVHSSLQPFFLSVSLTALYILLIVSVLAINQIDIINVSTILGGATVAVGLALSGTFQNFAGGVLILLLKPFELDDSIIAQGQDGKVTSIQIFYTVLLTADNKTVIIPNGKLFNEVIVNVTREGKRRLDFEVKVGYVVDIDQVKTIIINTVNNAKSVLSNPAIRVGIISLEVDSIRFLVNVWVKPADFLTTKMELQENIIKNLKAAGVKLLGT
ncbi:mechanosensitive ion channel family protein [Mucilaginibacter auburnensis]|uniref:Small conductance mechanosensitive channel n=1 Tax=Mucilaginibacter auburnensis TaxID=1457233 RepID=A0A2H9VSN2_9SPHI|nr:mechanosensitive ion channel domain-containing protein [Mucilaginibacter auburnensis]PJJ83830.1 small conductance mechanosensitive channel [Mucilaginibacter auburnensis]